MKKTMEGAGVPPTRGGARAHPQSCVGTGQLMHQRKRVAYFALMAVAIKEMSVTRCRYALLSSGGGKKRKVEC